MKNIFKKAKIFISQEEIIIVLVSIIFIIISILPNFIFYLNTPFGSEYTFLHNSVDDYPYYLSFIRQGISKDYYTHDQFTTEDQSPGLIHVFYLMLGKVGNFFTLTPIQIYFLARIIFALILLLLSYIFISSYLKNKWARILAFLIFLTSTSFPRIVLTNYQINIWSYLSWWTELDPLRRITFIPHFLVGHIGLVLTLFLFRNYYKSFKHQVLYLLVITGIILGFSHPPSLGMVYYILGGYLLINLIINLLNISKTKNLLLIKKITAYIIFVICTVPVLFYIFYTTKNIFPWTLMGRQELQFYSINIIEYLLALGPILPLGFLGILFGIYKNQLINQSLLIPILWILIDLIMIPLSKIITFDLSFLHLPTFSNIRFLSMLIQLPLSILTVFFYIYLRKYNYKLFISVAILHFLLTILMYPSSFNSQLNDFKNAPGFVYPSKSLISTYFYFNNNTKVNDVVLANPQNSLLLPLYAKNQVYLGQAIYTNANDWKISQATSFFSQKMSDKEAFKFLNEGNIDYILIDEENSNKNISTYKFLKRIYQDNGKYIYQFIK